MGWQQWPFQYHPHRTRFLLLQPNYQWKVTMGDGLHVSPVATSLYCKMLSEWLKVRPFQQLLLHSGLLFAFSLQTLQLLIMSILKPLKTQPLRLVKLPLPVQMQSSVLYAKEQTWLMPMPWKWQESSQVILEPSLRGKKMIDRTLLQHHFPQQQQCSTPMCPNPLALYVLCPERRCCLQKLPPRWQSIHLQGLRPPQEQAFSNVNRSP